MLQTFNPDMAIRGDVLPHERHGRGYLEAVAVARMAALATFLGRDQAIRWHGPAVVAEAPAAAPKTRRARKAAAMTGEAFFDARMAACRAVAAEHGERWDLVPGASQWASIPSKLRSFKTARGTTIKCRADARLPAARYWPGGVLPDGVTVAPTGGKLTPWVQHVRPLADGEFGPPAAYELHPMLARLAAAHAEQNADERARRNAPVALAEAAD